MHLLNSLRHLALAALLLVSGAAHATLYQFSLTGAYTASWQVDTAQPPEDPAPGLWATYGGVTGFFPGASQPGLYVTFYSPLLEGGFEIYDDNAGVALVETTGPQLYTGPESSPLFTPGTFALTELDGPGTYLLTIAEVVPAAVPEPATGALLGGGLLLLHASRRRRS